MEYIKFSDSTISLSDSFFDDVLVKQFNLGLSLTVNFELNHDMEHSFTKEGLKHLIKFWSKIPKEQRKKNTFVKLTLLRGSHKEMSSILESMPTWISEIKQEEGGDFNSNIDDKFSKPRPDQNNLKLTDGDKEFRIELTIFDK